MNRADHVQYITLTPPVNLPADALQWIDAFEGVTVIDVEGTDPKRWRVVTTLIHGNEPSGVIALHRWLRCTSEKPKTHLRFILCSLQAAKLPPAFTHRFLPTERDLNRCFGLDGDVSPEACRAQAIKQAILAVKPECLVDMHNTSGSGPAFAVSVQTGEAHRRLAGLFCRDMILTGLRLGALMEQELATTVITLECGGAHDTKAHELAHAAIGQLATTDPLIRSQYPPANVLHQPLRVELREHSSLTYDKNRNHLSDVCIRADIEQFNSTPVEVGERLGWINRGGLEHLKVLDELGNDCHGGLFTIRNNALLAQAPMQLFMATTYPEIARSDCLFYVIRSAAPMS